MDDPRETASGSPGLQPKPVHRVIVDGLRNWRTDWVLVIIVLYTAACVLSAMASSYPPAPGDGCTTMHIANELGGTALVLIGVGAFLSLIGLVAVRGRRWWCLALLLLVPILGFIAIHSILWPGANCRPLD